MIHVYATNNATWVSQRVSRLSRQLTERAKWAEFLWNRKPSFDGASGASEVFNSEQKTNFWRSERSQDFFWNRKLSFGGASGASGAFVCNKNLGVTERAKRAEFFICNKYYYLLFFKTFLGRAVLTVEHAIRA